MSMFQTGFSCFGREPQKLLGAVKIFIQVSSQFILMGGTTNTRIWKRWSDVSHHMVTFQISRDDLWWMIFIWDVHATESIVRTFLLPFPLIFPLTFPSRLFLSSFPLTLSPRLFPSPSSFLFPLTLSPHSFPSLFPLTFSLHLFPSHNWSSFFKKTIRRYFLTV